MGGCVVLMKLTSAHCPQLPLAALHNIMKVIHDLQAGLFNNIWVLYCVLVMHHLTKVKENSKHKFYIAARLLWFRL